MKSLYTVFTALFLTTAIVSCGNKAQEEAAPVEEKAVAANVVALTAEQYKMADIQLGKIEEIALSGTTKVNGILDVPPQNLVSISTPFGGFVKNTELLQGQKIRKGQVVALMQNPDYVQPQQDYLDYKSQLNYLKLDYDRQQELAKENVNTQKALQKAKSEYESMRARVSGLKTKLQLMNINVGKLEGGSIQSVLPLYSPINGYVTAVNTNVGAFAAPTDVLFTIADTEHLHAELTVFEKDVPKLKIGQKVRFVLANETKERMATVYLVGKEINSERTIKIHCHLDKEDANLLPGMYLQALVESGSEKVAAVPSKAIVAFEGSNYIFVGNQEKSKEQGATTYELVKVKTGISELNYTQLIFDSATDWQNWNVVTNGAYDLLSKMKNSEEEE
jgi:cobalt-zinc-cadmium efflux system membrane fusion protein